MAKLAGAVEYTDWSSAVGWPAPMSVLYMTQTIWLLGSSNAEALGNAVPHFITIGPRYTLARSGSAW